MGLGMFNAIKAPRIYGKTFSIMSIHQNNSMTRLLRTTSAAALLVVGTGLNTPAFSQSMPVTVDLSVLNDSGYGPATTTVYAGDTMGLIMPGADTPKSSYFGPSVSVSNPILTAPSSPAISQTASDADSQTGSEIDSQSTATAGLSTSDIVPPPPPEPVAVIAPAGEETVTAEVATTAVIPAAPEPTPLPVAPAESDVSSTSSSTTAIALEPTVPNAPPEAPEVVEIETTSTYTAADETSSSSAEATATEVATASSIASGMSSSANALQIVFGDEDSKLPGNAEARLNAIAEQIKDSDNSRIQLLAYAGGESLSASKARRLSLSRALSVRSFFIENGVRSTRIDVRALGNKTDEQPINRVDINIIER